MPTGTIKFFSAPKGFGFITLDEGGKDVFLPLVTLTAAGLTNLSLGQRVSFEIQPDKKGPKAISLALIAPAPPQQTAKPSSVPAAGQGATSRLTFYYDAGNVDAGIALAALRATGLAHSVVDYMTSPPSRDKLIGISLLLRENDQSLMRKYDPLFRELRLDDRFISQNELWEAIVEHPSLINGPILVSANRARICRSAEDVAAFLEDRAPKNLTARSEPRPALQAGVKAPVESLAKPNAATAAAGKLENPSARDPKPVSKVAKVNKASGTAQARSKAKPAKSASKTAVKAKVKTVAKAKSPAAIKKKKSKK